MKTRILAFAALLALCVPQTAIAQTYIPQGPTDFRGPVKVLTPAAASNPVRHDDTRLGTITSLTGQVSCAAAAAPSAGYFLVASNGTTCTWRLATASDVGLSSAAADIAALQATVPTAGQKAALAGTSGTPGSGNKYVTDADSRNSDARTPTAHAASHQDGGSDEVATITPGNGAIPKATSSGKLTANWVPDVIGDSGSGGAHGLVPAPASGDAAAGKFLKADGTFAVPPNSGGTVTTVSVTTANGVSGSVANATTTPAITLTLGAITPSSVAASGAVSGSNITSGGNVTGNAATVTTNANLTGPITSSGNATSVASQTGTGTKFVMDTSPTLVTPDVGVATATTVNKVTITAPASGSTLTIDDGVTVHATGNVTALSGSHTGSSSGTNTGDVPNTAVTTGTLGQFAATTSSVLRGVMSDESGNGADLFQNGDLGTPSAGVATNLTGTATALNIGGNAATVTTNANLTGPITSVGNATTIAASPPFTGTPTFAGSTSGTTGLKASATASGTLTLPAATDQLVGRDTTDTLTNKTLTTPTVTDFTNATHTHQSAAQGGTLNAAAITAGTMATARLGSGSATANTLLHGDQSYGSVAGADTAAGILGSSALGDSNDSVMLPKTVDRGNALTVTSGTTYCIYYGYSAVAKTLASVRLMLSGSSAAAGSQTAEVAIMSSSSAPDGANKTLTKLAASGSITAMAPSVTNALVVNTSSLNYSLAAGVHVWTCVRAAMATTQPSFNATIADYGTGRVCSATGVGALTSATSFTCSTISSGTTNPAPYMTLTTF
jgi:hypothetical protein